jgi:hypothetical protein
MKKILFILKHRDNNDSPYSHGAALSSGLLNSAGMIKTMLDKLGIGSHHEKCQSRVVQVIDNNCIDKHVSQFKPDIVVIEAIWVVPEKFKQLTKLHPNVKWIIRSHSNTPFIAGEGNAYAWLKDYVSYKNVFIACNTMSALSDAKDIVPITLSSKVVYFPNFYDAANLNDKDVPTHKRRWQPIKHLFGLRGKFFAKTDISTAELEIGCFGAIRLLKNQLAQAIACIKFAKKHRVHIFFHVNKGRVEGGGSESVIKNIRAILASSPYVTLVEHEWMPHERFLQLMSTMDLSLQVSFSETFNIVSADAVSCGIPVVVSKDINWVHSRYFADPTDADDIVNKMEIALADSKSGLKSANKSGLKKYNLNSHFFISQTLRYVLTLKDPV